MKELIRRFLPRKARPHKILGGPLRGARIVTSWHDYPAAILGRTERPLLEWFAANVRQGQTWIDVGAHYGYTAISLSRLVGREGRVFAFEPHISTAGCLASTRRINELSQLHVIPIALGTSQVTKRRTMKVIRGMVDSTINLESDGLDEDFIEAALDTIWPGLAGSEQQIHGVKIDVQGMEVETIAGMQSMLRRWLPALAVEVHQGVSRPNLLQLLSSIGYETQSVPIERLPDETIAFLADNRSYAFSPRVTK
jgi:FkbM family methyltransferase